MDLQNDNGEAPQTNGRAPINSDAAEAKQQDKTAAGLPVNTNGNASTNGTHFSSIPTAGEMVAAAFASEEGVTLGSFVARDEPSEYGYNHAVADERAVATLKQVLKAEGGEFDPSFEPGGETLASTKKDSTEH
jgi:hypothetical protein